MKLCKCGCGQLVKENNDYIRGHNRREKVSYTSGNRWAVNYNRCVECGTVKYLIRGTVFVESAIKEAIFEKRKLKYRSKSFDKCVECGTTGFPHRARVYVAAVMVDY